MSHAKYRMKHDHVAELLCYCKKHHGPTFNFKHLTVNVHIDNSGGQLQQHQPLVCIVIATLFFPEGQLWTLKYTLNSMESVICGFPQC